MRPEDLTKFGLIPEFIGRLPLIASVSKLDQAALIQILTEPRNALVKQYQKLFEIDGVELEFTEDAIAAIADHAMERGTGARGLRAIIEEVLLHVMYDVPSRGDVAKVVVTRETVLDDVTARDRAPRGQAEEEVGVGPGAAESPHMPGPDRSNPTRRLRTVETRPGTTQASQVQPFPQAGAPRMPFRPASTTLLVVMIERDPADPRLGPISLRRGWWSGLHRRGHSAPGR